MESFLVNGRDCPSSAKDLNCAGGIAKASIFSPRRLNNLFLLKAKEVENGLLYYHVARCSLIQSLFS